MITVLVDTTTTFGDVMMSRTPWMQILTLCAKGEVELIMPDVVLRETARHWHEEASAAVANAGDRWSKALKSQKSYEYLGLEPPIEALPDLPSVTLDPEEFYSKACGRMVPLGVAIAPVPKVDVETVLQRDLARRKPFEESGKGFRDALIWETVKEALNNLDSGDLLFLVTNNTNDYCLDGELHPDLKGEVEDAPAELRHVKTLDDLLLRPEFTPLVASLAKTDKQLAEYLKSVAGEDKVDYTGPSVGEIVKHALISSAEALVDEDIKTENDLTSGLNFMNLQVPAEIEGTSISWIELREETADWQTYETFEGGTLLIRAEIEAEISVQGFIYKSDYAAVEGEAELVDWEWNDHMAQVVVNKEARLIFQMRVDPGSDFVDDYEFEGVEPLEETEHNELMFRRQ